MSGKPIKILLIEGNPGDARLIREMLMEAGAAAFELVCAETLAAGLDSLSSAVVEILLLNLSLPDSRGFETFLRVKAQAVKIPIIILSGLKDDIMAVQAVHEGAQDYLTIDRLDGNRLWKAIRYAIERHHLMKKQGESERIIRLLTDNMSDMVFAYDMNKTLKYVNPAFETQTGYQVEELRERNFNDYLHPEDRERIMGLWESLFQGSSFADEEFRIIRKDGRERWFSGSWGPLLNEEGVQIGIQGREADITDRKHAEKALRDSEQYFRSVFENAPVGVCLTGTDGRFLRVNKPFCDLVGYAEEELLAMGFADITHPEDVAKSNQSVQRFLTGEIDYFEMEKRYVRKDGQTIWANLSTGLLRNSDGKPAYFISHVQDISEHKRAEEARGRMEAELRQAQKMEAVGQLAGGVAHDFNNMLSVILGYADMALARLNPLDPLYKDIQEIVKAGCRSADLTRQLLTFSRKQVVTPKVIDLNQVIDGQRNMLGRLIGEDIDIRFRPAQDLGPIQVDPSQIDQILANLAVNARDAISGVGAVIIETSNVVMDGTSDGHYAIVAPGDYVLLAFSDTGSGMDIATLERIFEPFFTTKEEGHGTGLGLSTVYGIVKQYGGAIHVYSEPGMGTTFKIYLPRFLGEVEPPVEQPPELSLAGKETVLIVEDEEQLLNLARGILAHYGYQVLTARSPGEACLLAEKHPGDIDLLLTDVIMPGMNGRELQERVARLKPGIKTIFMSGYTADIIAHRGIVESGDEFLQKPFSVQGLAEKVRRVLDG